MTTGGATVDPDSPRLIELAAGIWVRQEVDNMGWVTLGDTLVVVDTLERPETEAEVFAAIERTVPASAAVFVVNTHLHRDHVALNRAFQRRRGARIVNARSCSIPDSGLRYRDATVPDGRELVVLPAGGSHTADDCVVWLPREKIAFVGDIFGWGLIPWDAPLNPERTRRILAVYDLVIGLGARHVVPGHGPLCTTAEPRRWVAYFEAAMAEVKRLAAGGGSDDSIRTAVPPPADMCDWWRFIQWKHADVLNKLIRAARSGAI